MKNKNIQLMLFEEEVQKSEPIEKQESEPLNQESEAESTIQFCTNPIPGIERFSKTLTHLEIELFKKLFKYNA